MNELTVTGFNLTCETDPTGSTWSAINENDRPIGVIRVASAKALGGNRWEATIAVDAPDQEPEVAGDILGTWLESMGVDRRAIYATGCEWPTFEGDGVSAEAIKFESVKLDDAP